ncbi:MAG: glycosyltransferase family 2 protein [Chloroflexi bacterium]|nr:glycosyltransferase family 2 protein [Chloroflexota bacterium]
MPSISVVMPAYNEEANLRQAVEAAEQAIGRLASDYEIIVVDDGSRDRTAAVAEELKDSHSALRLVRHATNQGYGAALATGFDAAAKDLIFLTDSDLQFSVEEIERFLPAIAEGCDLVIGYRAPRRDPFMRLLYGWGWNWLINTLFGYTARDVDCAFKLFRRSVWAEAPVRSRGAMFSAEFLIRARHKGCRFREMPVTHLPRQAGRPTGGRIDVILRAFRELLRFRWQLIRGE